MRFIFRSDRWRSKGIICRKAEITLRQQGKQERSADPRKRDGMPRPLLLGEVALRSNDGEVLVMMERMCIAV